MRLRRRPRSSRHSNRSRYNSAGATDSFRTNSAVGLHLGYFIGSHFSLSGDLLYQRWLSHPTALNAINGAHVPLSDADMDTVTVAAGPRLHFRLGKQAWIRPGISFVRGLDARGVVPESARTRNGRFPSTVHLRFCRFWRFWPERSAAMEHGNR